MSHYSKLNNEVIKNIDMMRPAGGRVEYNYRARPFRGDAKPVIAAIKKFAYILNRLELSANG